MTERDGAAGACCLGGVLTGADALDKAARSTDEAREGVFVREEEAPDVDTSNGSLGRVEVFVVVSTIDAGSFPNQATSTTSPNTDNSSSALVPAVIFDVSVHQREMCAPLYFLSARLVQKDEKALGT